MKIILYIVLIAAYTAIAWAIQSYLSALNIFFIGVIYGICLGTIIDIIEPVLRKFWLRLTNRNGNQFLRKIKK